MQVLLKQIILVVIGLAAYESRAQDFFWVCSGDTVLFEIEEPYWGTPYLDYRENGGIIWQELGEWNNEPFIVDQEFGGHYRIRLFDEDCGESYNLGFGQTTVHIQVLDCQNSGPCGGLSVVSWGGHDYNLVEIGSQCWFAENLRYAGSVSEVSDASAWAAIWNNNNPTEMPAWCHLENDPGNDELYGKLYNWYAVNTGALCPAGWHIPTYQEYLELLDSLGGISVAGGKLKSMTGWMEPNVGATDESGFNGLPGLYRDGIVGNFPSIEGTSGYWWLSSEHPNSPGLLALNFGLDHGASGVGSNSGLKNDGYSCRCISDDFGTVINPATGRVWLDKNLGAAQVATSPTDSAAYGDLYQWGRGNDGHQMRSSESVTEYSSTQNPEHGDFIIPPLGSFSWGPTEPNPWEGVNGINNPCPDGFRLPTQAEWEEEAMSWHDGAFSSPLKLTMGGYRGIFDGNPFQDPAGLYWVGTRGSYWSSTPASSGTAIGIGFNAQGEGGAGAGAYTARGRSVRCIKD